MFDNNYEALHTFGDDQIVWNIDEYMRNNKGDKNG